MPQDVPAHSKLVFITYDETDTFSGTDDEREKAKYIATWIYQRLKYAGLPVRTYSADEAPGGGGFSRNSISASSPMIAVLSKMAQYSRARSDVQTAIELKKEVILALTHDMDIPPEYRGLKILDFRTSDASEVSFAQLKAILQEREYPAPKYIRAPDGNGALERARSYLNRDIAGIDDQLSQYYSELYYARVFADLYNRDAKIQALRDMGNYRLLPGFVVAALQDDSQEEVQAHAALALAKFPRFTYTNTLFEASRRIHQDRLRLYATIAHVYTNSPDVVVELIGVLKDWLAGTASAASALRSSTAGPLLADATIHLAPAERIFISYARRDTEELALNLKSSLESHGYTAWIDTDLQPGTPVWTREIEQAIRFSSLVIVLVSPGLHDSTWCKREISFAQELSKTILPITAIRTGLPIELSTTQCLRGNPILGEDYAKILDLLFEFLR